MALNYFWIAFFLIAFVVALIKLIFFGDTTVFPAILQSTFDTAKTGFEISIGLTGALTLWMGIMKVGEKGGVVAIMSKLISPLFIRIFPEIPKNHPVFGPMLMNFSMNFLGLDNAATPMGLKTMEGLQELNPNKKTATNAQIMFLVLNTSGLTLIPVSIMAYRATEGALNPADVFIPILLTTYFSTLIGLITVAIIQKINLFNKVILGYLGSLTLLISAALWYFSSIPQEQVSVISGVAAAIILLGIVVVFILMAIRKKVNVYEALIEGGKDGFNVAIKIIPYLIAILVAIGMFRTSGALEFINNGFRLFFEFLGINTDFVDALPVAWMKPLSGSGARAAMLDIFDNPALGVDSFAGKVASVLQGSTETTFYVLAVYFGAVKIKNTRYAAGAGLVADFAGIIAAIIISYIFFH
ncbi:MULTISPECIES: nucleoside recognition domain-containing protein [unclassified Roseivirga]|uniref:nucleoside recognition domain-containing protein n=1 Tax=unclassified Roseivirga TaxID=2626142 RepID=UPI002580FAD6|nr:MULTISPECIES: nucleoside recognition domain-containing protein [unclassified Roseivirga]MEC7753397.1 nucleoside recognition domain-containing protein [Bacteroidota bacterium]|tara:strand:- start:2502 stop:3740 length:1239 start_codon:yes stop_codon:yes gene_type:complete